MLCATDTRRALSKQTEIDFGTTPVDSASFTVADDEVNVYSRLFGSIAYEAPTDKDVDEVEMDRISLIFAPGDKQFTIFARGTEGYLADKFKVNYIIG